MINFIKQLMSGLLIVIFLAATVAQAKIDVYPFEDKALEKRFVNLIDELRCPKCQNNNLSGSNAGIAKDLKDLVYEKINNGETDKQIVDYLVARYGDFVSYDPPINSRTSVIWFGPILMLIAGFIGIIGYTRKRKISSKPQLMNQISDENKNLLSDWADDDSDSSSEKGENQ